MDKHKLIGLFQMGTETAELRICDMEKPDDVLTFSSPVREAVLKGAHPVQNLGAMITYMRRYLWMMAMELVEADTLDKTKPGIRNGAPGGDPPQESAQTYREKFDVALNYLKKIGKFDAATIKALFVQELGFENYQQMTDEQIPAAKRTLKALRSMAKAS